MAKPFEVRKEIEVQATPEQVWEATKLAWQPWLDRAFAQARA